MLTLLAERGEATATTLAGELPVSRVAVVKHLAVLDRAGLVEGGRHGREVRYRVPPERLDADRLAGWPGSPPQWDGAWTPIKRLAEEEPPPAR